MWNMSAIRDSIGSIRYESALYASILICALCTLPSNLLTLRKCTTVVCIQFSAIQSYNKKVDITLQYIYTSANNIKNYLARVLIISAASILNIGMQTIFS